ncbi:MAG: hypothetical protein IPI88_18990 [Chitinophagaceae bacterium]|nr:hypothetical protein [Chitinophagaceae bacterium]
MFGANRNTAVGDSAMALTVGSSNTAMGAEALSNGFNSWYNVAIGDSAMGGASGASYHVAVGYQPLKEPRLLPSTTVGF